MPSVAAPDNPYLNTADRTAVNALVARGAFLLRVAPDKRPAESRGFYHRQLSLDDLLAHVDQGGLVGMIPESVGMVVLDVDRGPWSSVADAFPPAAVCRSRLPQRRHLYFRAARPVSNQPWRYGTCSGEIRSRKGGYAIVWDSGALLDGLESPGGVDFADVLPALDMTPLPRTPGATGGGPAVGPATGCRAAILAGLVQARGAGLTGQDLWAAAYHLHNDTGHDDGHLPFSAVRPLVAFVRGKSWDSASQQRKALALGVTRRAALVDRDADMVAMVKPMALA